MLDGRVIDPVKFLDALAVVDLRGVEAAFAVDGDASHLSDDPLVGQGLDPKQVDLKARATGRTLDAAVLRRTQ